MENNKVSKGTTRVVNMTLVSAAIIFLCCLAGDIFGLYICRYVWWGDASFRLFNEEVSFAVFVAIFYLCTVITYGILFSVMRLLLNIRKNIVFDKDNTRMMKFISLGCFSICGICLFGMTVSLSLGLIALIGLFVGLIVRCVRIVMDEAINMRSELDLTI